MPAFKRNTDIYTSWCDSNPSISQHHHFSPEDGESLSPKRWHPLASLHGTKTQKIIIIIILTTVKTSNL
jgi:hypothetical protein